MLYREKDKTPGTNNLDGTLLRLVVEYIVTPVCHILNLSLEDSVPSDMEGGKGHSATQTANQSACYKCLENLWKPSG